MKVKNLLYIGILSFSLFQAQAQKDPSAVKSANKKYEKLATGLEIKLLEVLNLLNLPERPSPNDTKAKSNFNWMRP